MRFLTPLLVAAVLLASCGGDDNQAVSGEPPMPDKLLQVASPDMPQGKPIPFEFTCDGRNRSPRLQWGDQPTNTREMAILMEDPDAPDGTFVHWTAWGIDPTLGGLPAGVPPDRYIQGKNSFGSVGYRGPCPPEGAKPHRYQFHVYALLKPLGLKRGADAETVRLTIAPLAEAGGILTRTYGR